jgi:hypothetical protein
VNIKTIAAPLVCAVLAVASAVIAQPAPLYVNAQSATVAPTAMAAGVIDLTKLPLGDHKISTEPKQGYVYACPTPNGGGGGAFKDGPWINTANGTWDSTTKVSVSGDVKWPNAKFTITVNGTQRVISSNDLPVDASTGTFPILSSDAAYQYDRNPNHIGTQTISVSVPLNPTLAAKPSCVGMGMIGVVIDGVALFNGFDAENRDAGAHETQDACNGHPDISSEYHYHSISPCLPNADNSNLVGYAADGFGIYGFNGDKQYTNADLDECHGLTSEVLWNGQLTTIYHYQATHEFPYTIGCYRGTPVKIAGPGGGPGNGGPPGGKPPGGGPPPK